nr:viral DNA polymerase processivity factor [Wadden Sea poxvirus]
MTSVSDLNNLKELLKLYKTIHVSNSFMRERYNILIEWATCKYWKIGVYPIVNSETSIDNYYTKPKTEPFELEPGNYIFLPMYFGNTYIYKESMIELTTGDQYQINDVFKNINNIINSDSGIEFIRFILYKEKWIMEDVISKNQSPVELLNLGNKNGLYVSPYLKVKIDSLTLFSEDDYNAIEYILSSNVSGFYPEFICYIKEGFIKRYIIDFYKISYVYITSISLESVGDNMFIPKLITKSGKYILIRDVNHLIKSRIKSGSFARIKKKQLFSILYDYDNNTSDKEGEFIHYIIKELGNDFIINGKYLSKISNENIDKLVKKLGINYHFKKISDLILYMKNCKHIKKKLMIQSPFDIAKECLNYPHNEFITLVNNMHFEIKHSKVISFELIDVRCLNNPIIGSIYRNFNQFILLFNILIDVKKI